MKSGYFSQESLRIFQGQVQTEGGSTSVPSLLEDKFFTTALNTGNVREQLVADDIGGIRGEYIDGYDFTRCQRPRRSMNDSVNILKSSS